LRFRRMAEQRGWSVVESLCASAQPAGPIVRAVYESFRDEILEDLKAALPVDAVLLDLHGAMVAVGYHDCEGDLLERVREIVGPDVPIGARLDPHCHLTAKMVENATALIASKEYPHTDGAQRTRDLFELIAATVEGKIKPVTSVFDCRMIGTYYTTGEPMRSYVDRIIALEKEGAALSITVVHGFPWGDVPEMGTKILVITDNDPDAGERLAEELGRELFDMRHALRPSYATIDEGLSRALKVQGSPVVLADVSDNPGGGAPGDSTFILRAMLDRGIRNAALAMIWDPMAVAMAMDAGLGAELGLRFGGKVGPMSGDPVDLHVTVTGVKPNAAQYVGPKDAPSAIVIGDTVAVRGEGIDVVLYSIRHQTFTPDCFTTVGIDPRQRHILVVKSSQHFYSRFSPFAAEVLYVAAPGSISPFFENFTYKHLDRKIWPLVQDPFATT
jgi:microcystin degradation protein MlrC